MSQQGPGLQVLNLQISDVSERGVFVKLHAEDAATVFHTVLRANNAQLAQLFAQWFVHLSREERQKLVATMQELV